MKARVPLTYLVATVDKVCGLSSSLAPTAATCLFMLTPSNNLYYSNIAKSKTSLKTTITNLYSRRHNHLNELGSITLKKSKVRLETMIEQSGGTCKAVWISGPISARAMDAIRLIFSVLPSVPTPSDIAQV